MRILVVNGPNLNLLGIREPAIYGRASYAELEAYIRARAEELGVAVEVRQTNHEGTIVDWIHECRTAFDALILNAAAYTHTSVAILDALKATEVRTVEVHLSDPMTREEFRHVSFVKPAAAATFAGYGFESYGRALAFLAS